MKTLMVYRLKDSFDNKSTISVLLNSDDTLKYVFYESWQPSGTPLAISNLQLKKELPIFRKNLSIKKLSTGITSILNTGVDSIKQLIMNEKKDLLKKIK